MIYFLHAPAVNLVKIGRSIDPERRFAELRLLSPVDLVVIGMIAGDAPEEAKLHQRFAALHSHGEWFHATTDLRDFISVETLSYLWNAAGPEARERFLAKVDVPAFDRTRAGAA